MMAAHGIADHQNESAWWALAPTPPYYSNYCAFAPSESHGGRIAKLMKSNSTVADCCEVLASSLMRELGYRLLIEARWFGGMVTRSRRDVRWQVVRSARDLAAWEAAWQQWSPTGGQRVFPETLLRQSGVTFLRYGDSGGAIVQDDGVCSGLSNVFLDGASGAGDFLRSAAVEASCIGGKAVVGYGDEIELNDLAPLGLEDLGAHRVWIKASP